jgi:hypothetical protein
VSVSAGPELLRQWKEGGLQISGEWQCLIQCKSVKETGNG